jgi:putative ABC transport system ATP-binding protein
MPRDVRRSPPPRTLGPETDGRTLYELAGVTRSFRSGDRRVEALGGVDLRIDAGEHVAVTGPSGSGKTTLLQLLGALDKPTSGSLQFDGRELGALRERELTGLRLHGVGFVFQQFNLVPTLTARGNVEAALAPLGLRRAERRGRAHERLDEVGLGDRAGHLPSQLSGGEQQRVAIARALASEPRVVLADEPTGQLDQAATDAIAGLLGSLAGERTVVVVTHDLGLAARAPRVVRLSDGLVEADGASDSVVGLAAVELPVRDVAAATAWYRDVLGLEPGAGVELVAGDGPRGGRVWLEVPDRERARRRLAAAGVECEDDQLTDPDGNRLGLRPPAHGG